MNKSLATTFFGKIVSFGKRVRNNKYITRGLILLSILYTGVLFFVSIDELKQIDWRVYSSVMVIVFFVVGASIWLQALSWALIMKTDEFPLRYHLLIYFKTLLMKRLPGGVWHWVGRKQLYTEGVDGKKVGMKGNVIEWLGLLMSGLSLFAFTHDASYGLIIAILLFVTYQIIYVKWFNNSIKLSAVIFFIYTVCWVLGSFMIFLLITEGFHVIPFTFQQAVNTWTANGTFATLLFFLPSGIIVKEFTLVFLLDGVLSFNAVILLSLQLRILMLIAEILIGVISSLFLMSNSKQLMAN